MLLGKGDFDPNLPIGCIGSAIHRTSEYNDILFRHNFIPIENLVWSKNF